MADATTEQKDLVFCNLKVNIKNSDELYKEVPGRVKAITTLNAQIIRMANTNAALYEFINSNYTTMDGEIPLKAAKLTNPRFRSVEKLSGSDFVYGFFELAQRLNYRFFFLGGQEDSNVAAVSKVKQRYHIEIDGFSPKFENYPFSEHFVEESLNRIEKFRPQIVFVGFGAPKQEFFIRDNIEALQKCGVKFICGSGGTVDFVSGKSKTVPPLLAKMGFSSIFRFFDDISVARLYRILYSFGFIKYINQKPDFFGKANDE